MAVAGLTDEEAIKTAASFTLELLKRCVGIEKDDVVLEIGAGVGRVGAVVAPMCHKWIGVDASDNMAALIKRRLAQFSNVEAFANNGYDLAAISSNSIDVVYCTVVLMHLSQWDRYNYIKEAKRVLKPGGRLLVDSVNILSAPGWKFFEDLCAIPPNKRPPNMSELSTPSEFQAYFEHAGFDSIQIENHDMWVVVFGRKPRV